MASSSKHFKGVPGNSNGKSGSKSQTTPVSPDTPSVGVHIPIIKSKDNTKQLPVYSAALQKPADELLPAEDLDNIQLELESLLSNVALRYRVLKLEYENIDRDEKRNEKRNKHANANEKPMSPATSSILNSNSKRKREESSSVRKPKHSSSSVTKTKHSKSSNLAMGTDDSMDCTTGASQTQGRDSNLQKPALPKNDIPNKFWLSVEPYCMPLTNEDLRLLDDLLEQYSGPLVPPIPELGPHYSRTWAEEDLKDIQQGSNPNRMKQQNTGALKLLKKSEAILDNSVTGPLTQRLVSALMEDQRVQSPGELTLGNENSDSSNENQFQFRSLAMMRNGVGIEKRVKKELFDLGILDLKDISNSDDDEILIEIKRLIAELTSVAEYNSSALKRLHECATEEIKRLEIKRKLDNIDQEILELYKRTMQNKAKRKQLTAEEQQEIVRLTTEQKALSDQLERTETKTLTYE